MTELDVAALLSELVAIPTQQAGPDGVAGDERALCAHLEPILRSLGADEVAVVDAPRASGGPGGYVFARWGKPRRIVNAHVDTVPANSGWTRDPWTPVIEDGKLYGLGSCDTKGAIAATLAALSTMQPRDVGVLFSGDEERGTASVTHFLATPWAKDVAQAIVCEPTARKAGVAHRGVLAYKALLRGEGGHSSKADTMPRVIAQLARLAVAIDDLGRARLHDGPPDMKGLCLNVAALHGGVAFNVVPSQAELWWSIRPWPGFDQIGWERAVAAAAAQIDAGIEITIAVDHTPFRALDGDAMAALVQPFVSAIGPLDFWTEAALYAAAGIDAVVVGPGDIAQAHAADEWVTLADLEWAVRLYRHLLGAA